MAKSLKNNHTKNKSLSATITLIIVLSFASTFVALPATNAHTPAWNVPTFAYIAVTPNPVGVNQQAYLVMWIDKVPPSAVGTTGDRWTNYKVEITKPDGTKETLGPYIADSTSSYFTLYTPTQIGTYNFYFTFPGQVASLYHPVTGVPGSSANAYLNDTYLPSSATATLTVQQNAVTPFDEYPLPTEYWSRPIEGQNSNWANIASNWLGGASIITNFQQDGIAPNSPHIMWTTPLQNGGIVGGKSTSIPSVSYYAGLSYEGKFANPIIIQGKLYYPLPLSSNSMGTGLGASTLGGGYACVDLQTGQRIWWQNFAVNPTFGQIYDYESMNQHGAVSYLWAVSGTTWIAYEPETGNWLFNLTNVPAGTQAYTSNGEIVRYVLNVQNKWLALWNNTAAPMLAGSTDPINWMLNAWRPVGKVVDASTAYSWNVTIPALPTGSSISLAVPDDILFGMTPTALGSYVGGGTNPYSMWVISLKPATRGQLLWSKTYDPPAGNVSRQLVFADPETRMFYMYDKETLAFSGYSLTDGNKVWGPVTTPEPYNYYSYISMTLVKAYGNLYVPGFGGVIYCIDGATGKIEWTYGNGGEGNSTNSGVNTPWGNYPTFLGAVADNKLYLYSSEHSPNSPMYKGERIRAIDATTGEELWTILGWGTSGLFYNSNGAIADGYYAYLNAYDMQLYCIGKGPSATTIDAPMSGVAAGSVITLRGTVTDQTQSSEAKDTPAISDQNMGSWMEYLYMQKPKPTDAAGIQVKITAVDPNGNTINVGTATTDIYGKYGIAWTPTNQGLYQVVATFETTNSYWGSQDSTYFAVGPASPIIEPTVSPTTTPTTPEPTNAPTATVSPSPVPNTGTAIGTEVYIAIAAVIVIAVVAATALVLRKRK